MIEGRSMRLCCIVLIGLLSIPVILLSTQSGSGMRIVEVSVDPSEPTILDTINVSMVLSENANAAIIQYCGPGEFGLCYPPEDFKLGANDTTYFIVYEVGRFQEGDYHFNVSVQGSDMQWYYHDFIIDVIPAPSSISVMDLAPPDDQAIGLLPGQVISVTGRVMNDLGDPVPAWTNLSVEGTSLFSNITAGPDGSFQTSLGIPDAGSYTVLLLVTDPKWGFSATASWPVTVSEWPIPAISLVSYLSYNASSIVPGSDPDTFYTGSELSLVYSFLNSGTGPALNFTVITNISGSEDRAAAGELVNGTYLNGSMELPTGVPGQYDVILNCTFDQIAPEDLKGEEPGVYYDYTIVDKPTWRAHKVLIEMFTQTTCVPCVNVEEAIEVHHRDEAETFEYIMYVTDDNASSTVAEDRGVSATPHVFIDGGFAEMTGGGEVEDVIDLIDSSILNASNRITPPLNLSFIDDDGNYSAQVTLLGNFTEDVEGRLVVLLVESFPNIRNNQGIPVTNRFAGEIARSDEIALSPGGSFGSGDLGGIAPGSDLVAIFYDKNGTALQVERTRTSVDPKYYLRKETPVLRIEGIGDRSFNMTLERFIASGDNISESGPEPDGLRISVASLPEGVEIVDGDGRPVGQTWIDYAFASDGRETLACGRVRVYDLLAFTVRTLNNTARVSSFQMRFEVSDRTYTNSVALIQTEKPVQATPRVVDYALIGEGGSIFFTATVHDLPQGAIVKGIIYPVSTNGSSRGAAVTVVLVPENSTFFRAPVTGIDLGSYGRLAYGLIVELNGEVLNRTQEKVVLISDLIPEEECEGCGGNGVYILITVIIAGLVLISIIITVAYLVLRKRPATIEEEEGSIEGPEPVAPEPETEELAVPTDPELPPENSIAAAEMPAPAISQDGGGSPPSEGPAPPLPPS